LYQSKVVVSSVSLRVLVVTKKLGRFGIHFTLV
jgi:hypothetical protein